MEDGSPLSPSIFARLETLRQWQSEQQRKLIEQQSQQAQFLSKEHQRMYKALGIQQNEKAAVTAVEIYEALKRNKHQETNETISDSDDEETIDNYQISDNHFDQTSIEIGEEQINNKMHKDDPVQSEYYESKNNRGNRSIDDIPIKSPAKNFTALLEEKLKENNEPVIKRDVRPKKQYLKKGAGLRRFRMTMQDLAHKKSKPKVCLDEKKYLSPKKKKSPEKKKISPKRNSNNNKNRQSLESQQTNELKNIRKTISEHKESTSNFLSTQDEKYSFPNSPNMSPIHNNKIEPLILNSDGLVFNTKITNLNPNIVNNKNLTTPKQYVEPVVTWTPLQGNKPTDYHALLAELIEVRQRNPTLFDTPSMNQTNLTNQQVYERDILEELKMFEALELKAANSSFCSNSSLVTRFLENPIKSTPRKQLNFASLTNGIPEEDNQTETKKLPPSPKKNVKFADNTEQLDSTVQETEEETSSSSEESDNESSSDSGSSINSDDVVDVKNVKTIVPTKYQKRRSSTPEKTTSIKKDAATNTEEPMITSELLKTRLAELESELSTFRLENARINKLKSQLETENRNFERRKKQLEKDVEIQRAQMKAHLDEERAKLSKDRTVYNRYAQEIKEGKSARQKEREELNSLRSRVSSIEEEVKLKESKWAATQARIRSQLKHLEKENATLRTENNELRSKNGKLEATNKQLLSRRPSDTKVLHEINKNLTKLAQETKEKIDTKDKTKTPAKKAENTRRKSMSRRTPSPTIDEERDKENRRRRSPKYIENNEENYRRRSLNSTDESKSSTEHSFESIEREYEKLFGRTKRYEYEENVKVPMADASVASDISTRREETALEDGSKRISYANGNVKTISPDGQMVVMQYHNGDVKETCKETGTIRYLYADAKTWHTTYPDGMEVLEFANGQIEKRYPNGSSEILFPNGCQRSSSPGGSEEVTFPDGTLLLTRPSSGEKILTLPNGQREIHTKDHKRREYPDGTVKILYPDGVQETRYANGRIRLKDKQGNLIMDSASV